MHTTKQLFLIGLVALIGAFQVLNAQTPSWKWVKWSNGTQTTARSACADAAGNLYAAGTFNTTTQFDTAVRSSTGDAGYIVKYTETGNYVWARRIKNPGYAAVDCKSIAIDVSGNIYISGAFTGSIELDTKTLSGGGHYLAKYDNNGIIQWAVKVNGSNGVAVNGNGVFVAGGSTIQKMDASGAEVWAINGVKSNTGYTNFFSVALNTSGNLIVAGDIDDQWTFGTTLVSGGYQNMVVMEVKDDGTVNWAKVFGSSTNGADHIQHIAIDANDNIILTGAVGGATAFNTVNIAAKNGYLVKLNSTGTAQWGTAISNITTIYGTGGINVTADKDNSVYVTGGYGTADVTDGGSTVFTKAIKNGGNAFVLKFDASGVFKSSLVNTENPIINNSRGMALASSASGVYFAGVCAPSSEWGSLKVTGYGSVFAKIDGSAASGKVNLVNLDDYISLYPNPSRGIIRFENKTTANVVFNGRLSVLDAMGKTVYTCPFNDWSQTIVVQNLSAGIYILQIQTEKEVMKTKLILEQ